MKALKEKRISLRSLWRRGLVILSLFAFLLAACSDSTTDDNPSDVDNPGSSSNVSKAKINRIEITNLPARQYLGQPVDLKGIEAWVYYSDGTVKGPITDDTKFASSPRIVYGTYTPYSAVAGEDTFKGMDRVLITYYDGLGNSGANIWQFAEGRPLGPSETLADKEKRTDIIVGIAREDTKAAHPDWVTDAQDPNALKGVYDDGLNITGVPSMVKKAYYVDDERNDLNFANLKLEAFYMDGATKELSFNDVNWMIIPDYNRAKNAEGAHPGWLYITVGALEESNLNYNADDYKPGTGTGSGFGAPGSDGTGPGGAPSRYKPIVGTGDFTNFNDGGITKRVPLDAVYTVSKISVVLEKDMDDYFFFQKNTAEEWVKRLVKANAKLEIEYDGTSKGKSLSIDDLSKNTRIWWNNNPTQPTKIENDFTVLPLKYPFTKANPEPHILVYYRGGLTPVPIDVYTVLQEVKAESKAGGDLLEYPGTRPLGGRNNDGTYQIGGSEQGFDSKIKVTATYQAYNANAKKPSSDPLPLKWLPTTGNSTPTASAGTPATLTPKLDGAYYMTNYYGLVGVDPGTLKPDGTDKDPEKYGPAGGETTYYKGVKDGQTKAVVITHTVSLDDVYAKLKGEGNLSYYDHNDKLPLPQQVTNVATAAGIGAKGSQSKKYSLPVTWKK